MTMCLMIITLYPYQYQKTALTQNCPNWQKTVAVARSVV